MIFAVMSPKDKYKDDNVYRDIVTYCFRESKIQHNLVSYYNLKSKNIAGQMEAQADRFGKKRGTRIRHMILSFDPDREKNITYLMAWCIANDVCKFFADEYQIFAVVHEDTEIVHVHIVMNTVSIIDGKKYKGNKKDYYDFLEHLKKITRPLGLRIQTEYMSV